MTHLPGVYVPLRAIFLVFEWIFFILVDNKYSPVIQTWMSFNFGQIPSLTTELAALSRASLKSMYNVVTYLAPSY